MRLGPLGNPSATPLASPRWTSVGSQRIEDEASGFRFRLRSDATVEEIVIPAGTGLTRYRCALSRDGISIVYDIFLLPGGPGGLSKQEGADLLALKPADVRRIGGGADFGEHDVMGQPFDVHHYNDLGEPKRKAGAYRWIGRQYALMISIECEHPEDLQPTIERIIRDTRFPEN